MDKENTDTDVRIVEQIIELFNAKISYDTKFLNCINTKLDTFKETIKSIQTSIKENSQKINTKNENNAKELIEYEKFKNNIIKDIKDGNNNIDKSINNIKILLKEQNNLTAKIDDILQLIQNNNNINADDININNDNANVTDTFNKKRYAIICNINNLDIQNEVNKLILELFQNIIKNKDMLINLNTKSNNNNTTIGGNLKFNKTESLFVRLGKSLFNKSKKHKRYSKNKTKYNK